MLVLSAAWQTADLFVKYFFTVVLGGVVLSWLIMGITLATFLFKFLAQRDDPTYSDSLFPASLAEQRQMRLFLQKLDYPLKISIRVFLLLGALMVLYAILAAIRGH